MYKFISSLQSWLVNYSKASAVVRALIEGGGGGGGVVCVYSYIRVLPDEFLLKNTIYIAIKSLLLWQDIKLVAYNESLL